LVGLDANSQESKAMTQTATSDIESLAPVWRELQARAPVKLQAITSDRHYRAMVLFMNELLEDIGDRENHPLIGLLDIVTNFVHDYEESNVVIPDAKPAAVLRFLMDQHGLKQADLAELFGTQSNVSEALSGKREMNVRQAKALAKRFGVSPAVFI
jgi:HTH-type transcriptional regulator/antitoxin HigA